MIPPPLPNFIINPPKKSIPVKIQINNLRKIKIMFDIFYNDIILTRLFVIVYNLEESIIDLEWAIKMYGNYNERIYLIDYNFIIVASNNANDANNDYKNIIVNVN